MAFYLLLRNEELRRKLCSQNVQNRYMFTLQRTNLNTRWRDRASTEGPDLRQGQPGSFRFPPKLSTWQMWLPQERPAPTLFLVDCWVAPLLIHRKLQNPKKDGVRKTGIMEVTLSLWVLFSQELMTKGG